MADGHRVRLATHACFRDFVVSYDGGGLEFYPLAGDPVKLSEFMVKTHGCIIPTDPAVIKQVGWCVFTEAMPRSNGYNTTGSSEHFNA